MTDDLIAQIQARIQRAHNEIDRLNAGGRWKVSVPAQDNDSDLILEYPCYDAEKLIEENEALRDALAVAERQRDAARDALKPFADEAAWFQSSDASSRNLYSFQNTIYSVNGALQHNPAYHLSVGDFRRAAAALKGAGDG